MLPTTSPAPGTLDSKGRAFDPEKHSPRLHPRTGSWMPRARNQGRKPRAASAPAAPAPAPTAPSLLEAPAIDPASLPVAPSPDLTAQLGAEMAANMPEVTVADTAAAPASGASIDNPAPAPAPAPSAPFVAPDPAPAPAPEAPTARGTFEGDADVACRSLYFVTGLATGNMEEATATAAQHKAMRETLGAYFESKGIRSAGFVAVAVQVAAYLLNVFTKPQSNARLREWWAKAKADRAKPAAPAVQAKPAPQPAPAPAAPPPPPPPQTLTSELAGLAGQ